MITIARAIEKRDQVKEAAKSRAERLGAITIWGAIEKSSILLLKSSNLLVHMNYFAFWVHQYHFCQLYIVEYNHEGNALFHKTNGLKLPPMTTIFLHIRLVCCRQSLQFIT